MFLHLLWSSCKTKINCLQPIKSDKRYQTEWHQILTIVSLSHLVAVFRLPIAYYLQMLSLSGKPRFFN